MAGGSSVSDFVDSFSITLVLVDEGPSAAPVDSVRSSMSVVDILPELARREEKENSFDSRKQVGNDSPARVILDRQSPQQLDDEMTKKRKI